MRRRDEALGEEERGRSGKDHEASSEVSPYFRKDKQCGDEPDGNELRGDVDGALIGARVARPGTGERMGCRFIRLMMVLMRSRLARRGLPRR